MVIGTFLSGRNLHLPIIDLNVSLNETVWTDRSCNDGNRSLFSRENSFQVKVRSRLVDVFFVFFRCDDKDDIKYYILGERWSQRMEYLSRPLAKRRKQRKIVKLIRGSVE